MSINKSVAGPSEVVVRSIPLYEITSEDNSRLIFDQGELAQLMVSMKQTGQLQPIGLNRVGDHEYRIMFGNRRFLAAKKLGWKVIDATIFEAKDKQSEMIANATENLVRADISLPELGRIFHQFIREGMTVGEICARVSVPKDKVQAAIAAFDRVPVKFRHKITSGDRRQDKQGKISGATAMQILRLGRGGNQGGGSGITKKEQEHIFEHAIKNDFSAANLTIVGQLVKQGTPVVEALEKAGEIKKITVDLFLKKTVIEQLEKQYRKSINQILKATLVTHKEFEILE